MSALVPSTPTALPSATHCCHLGGCWCSKPLALACDNGGRGLAPKLEQQGAASRTGRSGKMGFVFLTRWPRLNTQQRELYCQQHGTWALPQVQEGAGASELRFPRDVALPSLCREAQWCAQGCPRRCCHRPPAAPEPEAMLSST